MNDPISLTFDVETTAINPLDDGGRLTCICAITSNNRRFICCHKEEKIIVRKFNEFLAEVNPSRIFGFNVAFDLRWVLLASAKHQIKPPFDLRSRTIDLRKILSFGMNGCKGTLNDYSSYFGLGKKLENDGASAVKLWKQGKLKQLKAYCMQDVLLTHKIMLKMRGIGLL